MEIRCLKAEHGDAIIIAIQGRDRIHFIVIDGGPNSKFCTDRIVEEYNKLREIDLMVLTHYDDDHIGGLIEYVKRHKDIGLPVKKIWSNCSSDIPVHTGNSISYAQAKSLENLFEEISQKQDLDWKDSIVNTMGLIDMGFCEIQILSPTPEALSINKEAYVKEIQQKISTTRVDNDRVKSLEELNMRDKKPGAAKDDIVNRSSIAFLLKAEGRTLLLMGDADPWLVAEKLNKMGYSNDNPLNVDLMKVSHHGSRNNVCRELLNILKCDKYFISTNGGNSRSFHPDRESLANIVICHNNVSNDCLHLYFNYSLKTIQQKTGVLLSDEEKAKYNCLIFDDIESITLN